MESIKKTLQNRLAALKVERFDAMRRAGEPFAQEMRLVEKMLAVYEGEKGGSVEESNGRQIDQATGCLFSDLGEEISLRGITKRLGKTTQEMVIDILSDKPNGLSALDILDEINRRWSLGLVRTSLSPQISRLKQKGKLRYSEGLWILTGKRSLGA
jgi:hypothetical protein